MIIIVKISGINPVWPKDIRALRKTKTHSDPRKRKGF